jgi:glycosyltransferase involved in cell wall biosynthesis
MISVILPTYNRAAYLRDSIGSVLQQEGVTLELLVIDDGSTDDTEALVASLKDDRIKYYKLPHTGRVSAMKNFAIDRSSGEFLAFMDSDDLWTPGKLARQQELLKANPELGFSLTDMNVFRDGATVKEYTYHTRGKVECTHIFPWIVEKGFLVYSPTLLLQRSCLGQTGYFDETQRFDCLGFNMRLAYHYQCGVFFEPMLLRRLHDSNDSEENRFQNYDEFLYVYERFYKEGKIKKNILLKARGNAFYKLGKLYASEHRQVEARKNYFLALKNDLFHTACYRSLLKSYLCP